MNKSLMKYNQLLKIFYNSLINLPSPTNISIWWNLGSILGLTMMIQIISGIFLSMHYCPNISCAFDSTIHITRDVNYGWLVRYTHMNGASILFFCMYLHIGRGIYYHSFKLLKTWITGILILLMSMATAFVGYVLPWGQMSYWGATVITNLLSAIPYFGESFVLWLWGGFSINNATLNRFYTIHFVLPFIILLLIVIHLMFLHSSGSNNPTGSNSDLHKVPFHPYFTLKDIIGFLILILLFMIITLQAPHFLGDPDNFSPASPMNTPKHIKPEWYFLFAYAILRSIPNKLGGVIALLLSILILSILPFSNTANFDSLMFYPLTQLFFWSFISSILILTWIGGCMVEAPFIIIGQISSLFYFSFYLTSNLINKLQDFILMSS